MSSDLENPALRAWIGRVIEGRYRIDEVLGEGGMGAVFGAQHLTLHKQVALKIVHPEQAGSEGAAARFAREAMVTSRIDHPNVISALDYGTLEGGAAYLAMELVRGSSLTEVLEREGSLHWSRAVDLCAQIADALSAAQQEGIVHRDLKPDNILVQRGTDGSERVKVLDFGVAKFARDSMAPPPMSAAQQVTQQGLVVGTPGYMAPEQLVGQRADTCSDIYALGVILWECVAGKRLWMADDLQSLARLQLGEDAPGLQGTTGDLTIPDALDGLLLSMLERKTEDRPQTAASVRDLLRDTLDGITRVPRRSSEALLDKIETDQLRRADTLTDAVPVQRDATPGRTSTPMSSERPRAQPRGRTSRLGLLALVVLLGAVTLVYFGQLEVRPKGEVEKITTAVIPEVLKPLPPEPLAAEEPEVDEPKVDPDVLPDSLQGELDALINGENRKARVEAADLIIMHAPPNEVPPFARAMAKLQIGQTCGDKKAVLQDMAELGDPRTLPVLVRLSQRRRGGCGKKGRSDCLACLRLELATVIEQLESGAEPEAAPEAVLEAHPEAPAEAQP